MTLYEQTQRLLRWRTYLIVGVILLGIFMTYFGQPILRLFIRPCRAAPAYAADVPAAVRDEIDALQRAGLLYCSDPLKGIATVRTPIYWGSDGLRSILFFQADSMEGVGVTRYGFGQSTGDAYVPVGIGAAPVPGFREDVVGRAAITNEAPDGARFFYRVAGAPEAIDSVVAVTVRGPAAPQPVVGGRDAFQDIERIWDIVRRRPAEEVSSTSALVPIAVLSERWEAAIRRDVATPFADEDGRPSSTRLKQVRPAEPTYLATVSGLLTSSVWVAGVVSGTTPALLLDVGEGATVAPIADSGWVEPNGSLRLHHFAFAPLAAGTALEARYWHDRRTSDARPPDLVWRITAP